MAAYGLNPRVQLAELREYSTRRGRTVTDEYVDEGVFGAKESLPALNRLMANAHPRRFAVLLVWKVDRFGRSLRHFVNALADLDLSTPSGRLMFQAVGAMAEFERALTQECVEAGLRLAKSKGQRLGVLVRPWMPNWLPPYVRPAPRCGSSPSG
jgi:DNA invertase Pin-like site-specific DNA recombinase